MQKIQCHFVISGNYVDFKHFEKSLPHLEKALELSKQLERNERLLSSAYYNLGKNYADLGINDKADHFLNEAAKVSESAKLSNLPHSLFTYAKFLLSKGKQVKQ